MPSRDLLHPELHAFVDALVPGDIDETTLELARKELAAMSAMVPMEHPGCEVTRATAPSHDGYDVPLVVVRPVDPSSGARGGRPAICWTHGGGYLAGVAEAEVPFLARMAVELGMVGVSVDYRLAPEHPHPAPVEDAYAALSWLHDHAVELGVDPARVVVGGESAGAGLAASLSTLARDRGGPAICRQLLVYPMLDDRTAARDGAGRPLGVGEVLWSPASNRFAWQSLLGGVEPGSAEVSPYCSPARADDLRGLPPTYLDVGDLDLFADECIGYAQRLLRAGVPTDLHVVAGAVHGYIYAGEDLAICRAHRDRVRAFLARA